MVEPDPLFMERALLVAERGRGRTSPNPMVGAVVVTPDGVVAGQGAHLEAGGSHAEVLALDAAGDYARGATLYSTLEPCRHTGRTGPCVERIIAAGIRRVVIASKDPNPQAGGGADYLRSRGIDVTEGVCEPDAIRQMSSFRTWITRRRPFTIAKAAVTADGFVGRPGERTKITGSAADRFFHRQRAEIDAIVIGSQTVLADDPLLTPRESYRYRPLIRVVIDWRLRIPASRRVFSTLPAGPVIMMVLDREAAARPELVASLERAGVEIERCETTSLASVFSVLAARNVVSVLIEGGPTLQDACAHEGLVDRIQVAIAPWDLGAGVPMPEVMRRGWKRADVGPGRRLGSDLLIEWDVHGTD